MNNKLPNRSNLEATSCVANTIVAATPTNHTELLGTIASYRSSDAGFPQRITHSTPTSDSSSSLSLGFILQSISSTCDTRAT